HVSGLFTQSRCGRRRQDRRQIPNPRRVSQRKPQRGLRQKGRKKIDCLLAQAAVVVLYDPALILCVLVFAPDLPQSETRSTSPAEKSIFVEHSARGSTTPRGSECRDVTIFVASSIQKAARRPCGGGAAKDLEPPAPDGLEPPTKPG